MKKHLIIITLLGITAGANVATATTLLQEDFVDTNFAQRGWYDNTGVKVTAAEHIPGSTSSAAFIFSTGGTTPSSGGAMRKQFTESDTLYLSFWQKYASNWMEQAGGAGHHEIYLLTNQDSAYSNLAFTHLTSYLETWGVAGQVVATTPHVTFQDGANTDQTKINVDLTKITENRSVSGCNGLLDSNFKSTCYNSGSGTYWNGKYLSGGSNLFSMGAWHHVEVYYKMNSIASGKAVADGTVAYWLDGQQVFTNTNVVMRTGQYPNMKFNQLVIGPYMGNGAPANQTFWLDDLLVSTVKPAAAVPLEPPTNLIVVP